jgi:hypothetical protein
MVMIQKQSNNRHRITNSKKGMAGPKFNKELLIVFFNMKGTVHCESVPPNITVNSDFYCDVMRCLREIVRQKKTETLAQPQLAPSS